MHAALIGKREEVVRREAAYYVVKEALRLLGHSPKGVAVDVGGGDGSSLALLGESVTFDQRVSVDVELPANGGYKGITYRVGDAENLGSIFGADSADLVLMIEVIEHLLNPDDAILEVQRILHRGGALILTTPNLSSLINRLSLLAGYLPLSAEVSTRKVFGRPGSSVAGHLRLHTFRSLRDFLSFYDFKIERMYTFPNSASMYQGLGALGRLVRIVDRVSSTATSGLGSRILVVARPEH
jgi:SAM-dependent methyltransferase